MREGRGESRVPAGSFGQLELLGRPRDSECARFENVSAHGARILSRRPWQSGDRILITSRWPPFCSAAANVVYCQNVRDGLYAIGCRSEAEGILRLLERTATLYLKDAQATGQTVNSLDCALPIHSES